jgi:hypothetical protein
MHLELQRYFKAAEEAAREIMLEEAINIQRLAEKSNQVYIAGAGDTEGVVQLTTLSSLPLKSPKRLIALQLANNNPAFRERFKQKLEASGGPIIPHSIHHSHHHDVMQMDASELEKYLNSPALGGNNSDSSPSPMPKVKSKTKKSRRDSKKERDDLEQQSQSDSDGKDEIPRKSRKGRKSKLKGKDDENEGIDDIDKVGTDRIPKKRGRKRKVQIDVENQEDGNYSDELKEDSSSHLSGSVHIADSSIIKRRRKGELRVVVDGGVGFTTTAAKNNLHSLMGGGLGDMGPPGETPRRSARMKNGQLSSLSNLNPLTFSNLDSPFGSEKPLMFSDVFSAFGVDTPGTRGLSGFDLKTGLTTAGLDSVRFDFDEAVAGHFPSPRAGEHLMGNSPYRWSAGSVGSVNSGFFTFPDGILSTKGTNGNNLSDPTPSSVNNAYIKKYKKAHSRRSGEDNEVDTSLTDYEANNQTISSSEIGLHETSNKQANGDNIDHFQSPNLSSNNSKEIRPSKSLRSERVSTILSIL